MPTPSLIAQTTYAELLERCAASAFSDAFPDDGTFTPKAIKGRRYWYFQTNSAEGRSQRYVGPESAELLERIAHHKQARDDERERRALVSALVRSYGFPSPLPQIGGLLTALARAGVFRLRGVLIGTVAYQCYPIMLGYKLPGALARQRHPSEAPRPADRRATAALSRLSDSRAGSGGCFAWTWSVYPRTGARALYGPQAHSRAGPAGGNRKAR